MAERPRNRIDFADFDESAFATIVREQCGAAAGAVPNDQTEYLGRYLRQLGAVSLVVEHHYVDRHYLEEYSAYYSKGLVQRPSTTARIHAFKGRMDRPTLRRRLNAAASGDPARAERARASMEEGYLGFIVVRPISSVPIGRTVLRPLEDDPDRRFEPVSSYRVHVLGFKLRVQALAFQQQDLAVGACATTAAWTVLQRVRRREGHRCPSPFAITEAAVEHTSVYRPFPSNGLTAAQISRALRRFQFAPDYLSAKEDPELFVLLLNAYLRSGIPAVLALSAAGQGVGHAVAAVGYHATQTPLLQIGGGETLVNSAYDRLYIHDDRMGPYARAHLTINGDGVELMIDGDGQAWSLDAALVPLYPKLRSSAGELWLSALDVHAVVKAALDSMSGQVGLELFFARSGSYMSRLHGDHHNPARLFSFLSTAALSRYVGVVRWSLDAVPVLDALWDTTDRTRQRTQMSEHLLGVVALDPRGVALADTLAEVFGAVAG